MKIFEDIEVIDLALLLKKEKTLIITDIHIGYEEALNKQGILIPKFQQRDLVDRIERILKKTKPKLVVIAGDLKHEFGNISETEWRHTLQFLDLLSRYAKRIILLKGNHDTLLDPIARKRNIVIKQYHRTKDKFIIHGDKILKNKDFKESKIIIIGNEHPAISLREGPRSETYKCFLKGKYRNKTLIVIPSFNLVTEGTDVSKEKLLSPFLNQNLEDFYVYIVSNKIYRFGKLKNIKELD